jgi:hypothetical protein
VETRETPCSQTSCPCKPTTTNRHSTKMWTTFCVFLLTPFLLALILPFQIRGTWKRQADRVEAKNIGPCDSASLTRFKTKNRARTTGSAPATMARRPAVRLSETRNASPRQSICVFGRFFDAPPFLDVTATQLLAGTAAEAVQIFLCRSGRHMVFGCVLRVGLPAAPRNAVE